MNDNEIQSWKEAVSIHTVERNRLVDDRKEIKSVLEAHLKQFFNYDCIEYCDFDFNKIKLIFEKGKCPVVREDMIDELKMDWIISTEYDDKANNIIVFEIYPFGVDDYYKT